MLLIEWFSINISLKFVPKSQINNISAFGPDNDVAPTRRQAIIRISDVKFTGAYMHHSATMS